MLCRLGVRPAVSDQVNEPEDMGVTTFVDTDVEQSLDAPKTAALIQELAVLRSQVLELCLVQARAQERDEEILAIARQLQDRVSRLKTVDHEEKLLATIWRLETRFALESQKREEQLLEKIRQLEARLNRRAWWQFWKKNP